LKNVLATIVLSVSIYFLGALGFSSIYEDAVLVPLALSPVPEQHNTAMKIIRFVVQPWIAELKLRITGLEGCYSSIAPTEPQGSMINTLVILNENLTDKVGVQSYISQYISMGCDINSVDISGLSPLHNAVLAKDVYMVRFLLSNGASKKVLAHKPDSKIHGLNSVEFLKFLNEFKPSKEFKKIEQVLNNVT